MGKKRHRRGADAVKELYVFCEGRTEQSFCNQVLRPHLFPEFDGHIHTLPVGWKAHLGVKGVSKNSPLKRYIAGTLKSRRQRQVYLTTMIDLYGLPADFPGKSKHVRDPGNPRLYAESLEESWRSDIGDGRFLPHLQLHEFESLLLVDPDAFALRFRDCANQIEQLKEMAAKFGHVEKINDSHDGAPSRRIAALFPEFPGRKATAGPDIAASIGLPAL